MISPRISPINFISSPRTISPIEKNNETCEDDSIDSLLKSLEEFLVKKSLKTDELENFEKPHTPKSNKTTLPFIELNTPKRKPKIIVKLGFAERNIKNQS
jgi:hypothetical protein